MSPKNVTLSTPRLERVFSMIVSAIKIKMDEEGISMSEMQRRSGISRQRLYDYFNGKDKAGRPAYPRLAQLFMLADALDMDLDITLTRK